MNTTVTQQKKTFVTLSHEFTRVVIAYDEDLRWCMVWQRLINGYTIKEIESNLYVAESTLGRVGKRHSQLSNIQSAPATRVRRTTVD